MNEQIHRRKDHPDFIQMTGKGHIVGDPEFLDQEIQLREVAVVDIERISPGKGRSG